MDTQIRIDLKQYQAIKKLAKQERRTIKTIIAQALFIFLKLKKVKV